MKTPEDRASSNKPSKAMQISLWIAAFIFAALFFYLMGRVVEGRNRMEADWDAGRSVEIVSLEGILASGQATDTNYLAPLIEAERTMAAAFGRDTLDGAAALNRLANLHALQGDYTAAKAAYREARAALAYRLGEAHPDVAVVDQNLETLEALKTNAVPRAARPSTNPPPSAPGPSGVTSPR